MVENVLDTLYLRVDCPSAATVNLKDLLPAIPKRFFEDYEINNAEDFLEFYTLEEGVTIDLNAEAEIYLQEWITANKKPSNQSKYLAH